MYKINDIVMYKKDVCRIKDIKTNSINGNEYYVMVPLTDESLIIDTPVENRLGYIKDLISLEEVNKLISEIPNLEPFENLDDKNIEMYYKHAIYNGNHRDLIRVIKSSYIRNDNRLKNNKKISEKDDKYFKLAEKYLYTEFASVLNISFEEVKEYILKEVEKNLKTT